VPWQPWSSPRSRAGCGSETLDTAEAEDTIKSFIQGQTGANVSSVDCPDDVNAEKGTRFACEVTAADGSKATIDVEQTSDEGNIDVSAPLLQTRITEEFITESLRKFSGRRATVDCPDLVLAKPSGTQLTCKSSSGANRRIAVKVDAQGQITWDID
jgi:hypothetical protein